MRSRSILLLATICLTGMVSASQGASHPAGKDDSRADIARRLDVAVTAVHDSVIPGLYEIANGGEVIYVSADGRYAIKGDIYDTDHGRNITDRRRADARQELLRALPDEDTIIFAPAGKPRYTVTVFTDVECKYCRMFHSEIAEFNRLGIRVRYAFYPRSGPGSEAWRKADSVWCSANRQESLTKAILAGEGAVVKSACRTPVGKTYELGKTLGMMGTPGIFTEHGSYVTGYKPPAQLVELLRDEDSRGE